MKPTENTAQKQAFGDLLGEIASKSQPRLRVVNEGTAATIVDPVGATTKVATGVPQSPLAEVIDALVSKGYGPMLRPCPPPGVPCWFTDHQTGSPKQRIADGKVPGQFRNGEWYGWRGWRQYVPTAEDFTSWRSWPGAGLCLVTGTVAAIDIDIKIADSATGHAAERSRQLVREIKAAVAEALGVSVDALPMRWRPGTTSCMVLARLQEQAGKRKLQLQNADGVEHAIEFLADGQQIVISGVHESGQRVHSSLVDTTLMDLPTIATAAVQELMNTIGDTAGRLGFHIAASTASAKDRASTSFSPERIVLGEVMARRSEWVPAILPTAGRDAGEWRMSSAELERELDEDLVIYADGIQDFGTERSHTPSSAIAEFGAIDDAGDILFGGCPDYGAADGKPYAVIGNPDPTVRRPTEAQALTWLCRTLSGRDGSREFPVNATWRTHWQAVSDAIGLNRDALANKYLEASRWYVDQEEPDASPEPVAKEAADVFRTLTLHDLLSMPDPVFVIDRHIPEQSLGFLYGAPGSKKSFIALDWALHLAYGRDDWHGDAIKTKVDGVVLYLAGEGAAGMKNRVRAWLQQKGIAESDPRFLRFHLLPHSVDLMRPDNVKKLARTLRHAIAAPVIAIVVDTVSRALPGADENLQKDMTRFVQACDAIKQEFECAVLGVHHASRNGPMRGSTVLQGAGDFVFRLDCKKGKLAGHLHCEKQKDAPDGWTDHYRFDVVHFGDGASSLVPIRVVGGSTAKLTPEIQQQVLEAIDADWHASTPWAKTRQSKERWAANRLQKDFGISLAEGESFIDVLEQSGRIEMAMCNSNKKLKGYRVVDDAGTEGADGVFA